MNEYFAYAYLDDYNLINLSLSKKICQGISDRFHIVLNQDIKELKIISQNREKDSIVYQLSFDFDLTIGLPYQVMMVNGYTCPLTYRYIVKTKRFNEEFYYDSDDLGAIATAERTSFKLWAPTASKVILCIGEKYFNMKRGEKGVYHLSFKNNLFQQAYYYMVEVNGKVYKTLDPYGKASLANSSASVVTTTHYMIQSQCPQVDNPVIYEVSVRDYTKQGNFEAMRENIDYIADLGVTHVQLQPVNDFGSVNEYHKDIYYNWGYDPVQYMSLEGSYSSNPSNPLTVNEDFGRLVHQFHEKGIRVILDVVFNHHYYALRSSFNRTVPYYFYRYDKNNELCDGTGCGSEMDSRQSMARKFILDTLVYYVEQYGVDGYRFDLMGFTDITTMNQAYLKLKSLKDDILIYGEGWNMTSGEDPNELAHYYNDYRLEQIGFFNDSFRDTMKGSSFEKETKGYCSDDTSLAYKAEHCFKGNRFKEKKLSINYVECHDDLTAYDKLKLTLPQASEAELKQRCKLMIAAVLLAQGTSFLHAGQEYCLSKKGIRNCYNQPDSINKLTEEMKVGYEDVIQFTKDLIELKKKHYIGKNDEVYIHRDQDVILMNFYSLVIIFNPTDKEYNYPMDGQYLKIFDETGKTEERVSSSVKVNALSVCILERA